MSGPVVVICGLALPAVEVAQALRAHAEARVVAAGRRRRTGAGGRIEPFDSARWAKVADALEMTGGGQVEGVCLTRPRRQTLNEWAEQYAVPERTARRWANSGRLRTALKTGNTWTVDETQPVPEKGKHHGKNGGGSLQYCA